jgi:hypothetical protein
MSDQRRALSPVIATVILAGVVLTIGGAIWSYSLGAAAVTADAYVSDTMRLLNEMQERFAVENVFYNSTDKVLKVWVYNYGKVNVTVDVYVNLTSTVELSENHFIEAYNTSLVEFDFSSNPLPSHEQVAIKVYSRRQNVAYKRYYVP